MTLAGSTLVLCSALALAASRPQTPVSGTVFLDANANGTRDPGERALSGVMVSNQDTVVRTDPEGRFAFAGGGTGVVFVTVPRAHRAVNGWWRPAGPSLMFALAPQREPVPFRFVHASDPHIAAPVVSRTRRLVSLVDSVAPSLLLVTGDLVRDALRVPEAEAAGYYDLFEQEMASLRTPLRTVPGNHEMFGIERARSNVAADHPLLGRAMYRQRRGPDYYSFDAGGVHFVALNTVDIEGEWYYGHVDARQLAWLRQDLALVPDSVPVVTFSHIPLVTAAEGLGGYTERPPAPSLITIGGRPQYRHVVSNLDEVLAAIAPHRLELALAGHVHFREQITLVAADGPLRFHQAPAIVGDATKAGRTLPSGVLVYTVRGGRVDDGRFVPTP